MVKVHIQHVMLCEFKNSNNITETAKKIYCDLVKMSLLTAKSEMYFQFSSGDISLRDEPRSGC